MKLDRRYPALAALALASALWVTWPGAEHAGFAVALAALAGLFVWRRERGLGLVALAGAVIATSTFDGDGPRAWAAALLLLVPTDALLLADRAAPRVGLPIATGAVVGAILTGHTFISSWEWSQGLLTSGVHGTLTAAVLVAGVGATIAIVVRG